VTTRAQPRFVAEADPNSVLRLETQDGERERIDAMLESARRDVDRYLSRMLGLDGERHTTKTNGGPMATKCEQCGYDRTCVCRPSRPSNTTEIAGGVHNALNAALQRPLAPRVAVRLDSDTITCTFASYDPADVVTTTDLEAFARLAEQMRAVDYSREPETKHPMLPRHRTPQQVAKELIAAPPEWAYPTAWTAAVLAALEDREEDWFRPDRFEPALLDARDILECAIEAYHHDRREGKTHSSAMSAVVVRYTGRLASVADDINRLATIAVEAYARAMEPAERLLRPGVTRRK
jgi:hypothetical protein